MKNNLCTQDVYSKTFLKISSNTPTKCTKCDHHDYKIQT